MRSHRLTTGIPQVQESCVAEHEAAAGPRSTEDAANLGRAMAAERCVGFKRQQRRQSSEACVAVHVQTKLSHILTTTCSLIAATFVCVLLTLEQLKVLR